MTKLTRKKGWRNGHFPVTHGMSKRAGYQAWFGMMERCYNPNHKHYRNYGGRGIDVCERWHDVANFINDMGPRPAGAQIERIENHIGYRRGNCIWTTAAENNRNKRTNRKVTAFGRTQVLTDWAAEMDISYAALAYRLDKLRMSPEEALSRAPDQRVRSDNNMLTARGETKRITDWSRDTGVSTAAIRWRLRHGWTVEDALFRPPENRGRSK